MFVSKDFREWLRFAGICLAVAAIAGAVSWTVAGLRSIDSEAVSSLSDDQSLAPRELPPHQILTLRSVPALGESPVVGGVTHASVPSRAHENVRQVNYVEPATNTSYQLPAHSGQTTQFAQQDFSRPRRLPIEVDEGLRTIAPQNVAGSTPTYQQSFSSLHLRHRHGALGLSSAIFAASISCSARS